MKNKLWKIIFILIIFYGCKKNQNIDGYYYTCDGGVYSEVYFNNNLMRMASENEWIGLSEWRKIEIKNNTLKFETFGEWRNSVNAKIEYIGMNEIRIRISGNKKSVKIVDFKPIKKKINFKKGKEFWNGFYNRKKEIDCSP